ncbi:MAG: hypothetical protein ACTTJ6_05980 [Treponema sp.]
MRHFYIVLFFLCSLFLFSQEQVGIDGVWENGGRFLEFRYSDNCMRVVLKPYYETVYDEPVNFSNPFDDIDGDGTYGLSIKYQYSRKSVSMPIFVYASYLFTSFYKKVDFELLEGKLDGVEDIEKHPLFGFWVEQGSKEGIRLYPNEPVKNFDAYFFEGDKYIKFRYWYDENLGFSDGKAVFKGSSGLYYKVPKMIKRGDMVYSCITTNGSSLRNYEVGSYSIETDKFAQDKGVFLVLSKEGVAPGKTSVSDNYSDYKYANKENIPLYIATNGTVFAIGGPFLFRSSVQDLDAEIKKRNSSKSLKKYQNVRDEDIFINQ